MRGAVLHAPGVPARTHQPGAGRPVDPGKVFDLTLPLDEIAEGYRAMDERRAIKALLRP
jgi:threonine dehydrogenase-like Zn-dependent dehydrogenase